ncbi:MAG TPA: PEP-CTERM sorting domain-containing protein [Bryobacteraceae bacterium]|jgi:hypothetical protein|nr:PEP-CTERM sorting domain-containing protein [Bryobacteraceae bacterium]
MTPLRLILVACVSISGGAIASATTLNFSFNAQETKSITLTDAPAMSCGDASGGNQYPLGCQPLVSNGGYADATIGGTSLDFNSHTIDSTYSFDGHARAAIFPQPGADTSKVSANYSFEAMISPVTSGDTIVFTLSDVNTCSNTLGGCNTENVLVYGASSIKGNLTKGEKITAAGPVILDLAEDINVYNVVPSWTKDTASILDITPVSETAPKHHHFIGDAAAFADPVTTPEPGSMGLFAMALAGFALVALRRTVLTKVPASTVSNRGK